ncbi:phospholipase DDHD1-like [Dendronephthya gigantea]|uniref:phospholipase DDHD1-like n=1 Tax=Dendronephthya gigantea TaxID=151771 RepID=UPI00106AB3A9|nr:phospholipase DDHD1-like [Dendronephthya gigantea]
MDDPTSNQAKRTKIAPARPPPPKRMPNDMPSTVRKHYEELSNIRAERVRWFYFEDKKWSPFCGQESLRIEQCYRSQAKLSSHLKTSPDLCEVCTVLGGLYDVDVAKRICKPVYWKADPLEICRGTWFKGSASETHWTPITEEEAKLIEQSHQMLWHSMGLNPGVPHVNNSSNTSTTINDTENKNVLCTLQLSGYYVEWTDLTEVWLHSEGVTSKIFRGMVQKIGGSTGVHATPLHRGYHTECRVSDCPADVTHLVFVIHGIGQLMNSSINECCHMLRNGSKQIAEKYFKEENSKGRVEFVPVEWRSSLKLDEGVIDLVTPHTVRGVRNVINTSMMDIMYYTSPFYREEIIGFVKNELNKLYNLFLSRHPTFQENGNVSIIAHSLGSVIIYDILERWDLRLRDIEASTQNRFVTDSINYLNSMEENLENSNSPRPGDSKNNPIHVELAQAQLRLEELDFKLHNQMSGLSNGQSSKDALHFKVANCFLIGSPLAVFFTLRGFRPGEETEKAVMPQIVCKRLFNIYDQCDPVAYRLEPLFRERYSNVEPVHIKGHAETNYTYDSSEQILQPDSSGGTGNWLVYALIGQPKGGKAAEGNAKPGPTQASTDQCDGGDTTNATKDVSSGGWFSRMFSRSTTNAFDASDQDAVDGDKENADSTKRKQVLSRRIDYTLSENRTQYWSAITSHLSYWNSKDLCRFVLHQIYSDKALNHDQ